VTAGPSAMWYLTRGTGAVTLLLLTISVALGVANVRRVRTERVPRFVIDAVHRNASLLALAFLAVHIGTSVLDTFAPIRLIDVFVPFVAGYRPVWLGLGTVATDLLIAVALTSVLRRRLGHRTWRTTHWLAYACWPVALVHGLGTGSDPKATWMLALTAGCVLVVLAAVWIRATAGWPDHIGTRATAVVASIAAPVALLVWLPTGPLASGWAKRAGTPSSLLRASTAVSATAGSAAGSSSSAAAGSGVPRAFTAQATGTVSQSQLSSGLVQVDLHLALSGQSLSALDIRLDGQPLGGGGVAMSSSTVTLGQGTNPALYTGQVTGLEGSNVHARVRGRNGSLAVTALLQIDQNSGTVTGSVNARPAAPGVENGSGEGGE
jgi:sulfoxide reductase heme-binding subunit YedZ